MDYSASLQLGVEVSDPDTTVVRVAGALSPGNGARLLRLLDALLSSPRGGAGTHGVVLVDLGEVRRFDHAGVVVLRHAWHRARAGGIGLRLTGIDARRAHIPRRIIEFLDGFGDAPALEDALAVGPAGRRTPGSPPEHDPPPPTRPAPTLSQAEPIPPVCPGPRLPSVQAGRPCPRRRARPTVEPTHPPGIAAAQPPSPTAPARRAPMHAPSVSRSPVLAGIDGSDAD